MNAPRTTRALMVSACASGQGKTTVTAALALAARARGERVRLFKTGADFIDPMVLSAACGEPVWQLDLFMGDEAHCRSLLWQAAGEADLVIVEGVMGLYDGAPSSADLAERFGLPVLAVIDAGAMAGTFGAVALGLQRYREALPFHGVVANRVAGAFHAQMLQEALPADIAWCGWLPRDAAIALPERHLGLNTEAEDVATRLRRAAAALQPAPDWQTPQVRFDPPESLDATDALSTSPRLDGCCIAIARDAAFCFLYPANLACLQALGAECRFFSPLAGDALPACDAVWLPGGYPELHAAALARAHALRDALHAHHRAGKPTLAECGGMMSLFDTITDAAGHTHAAFGLLPGHTRVQPQLAGLGLQEVTLPEGVLRGHSFHHSVCETPLVPIARAANPNGGPTREPVYRVGRTTASYFHAYFPSNPVAVAALFGA